MNARLATVALLALSACSAQEEPAAPPRADWIVESHLVFVAADLKTPRPVPNEPLRLWLPYVVGDIYGAPNAGELVPASLKPDLSFSIDLNQSHAKLEKSLIPTAFSQKWMKIEPAEARIARLSPFVLPVDGIQPVGNCEWLDADTGDKLMLIFIDRPARVRGEIVYEGRNLLFDIVADKAGYLWMQQPPEGSGEFRKATWPGRVVLAVMPNP